MPKVAVASVMHESNSFNSVLTRLDDFRTGLEWFAGNTEVAGFLEETSFDIAPAFFATATPGGPVEEDAYEKLVDSTLERIQAAGAVDGVFLALHGAMVAEHVPHADEEIVRRVRNLVGPEVPLVVTHDFHANISPETVKLTTALLTYQQNPHLDTKQRGRRAASILAGTIRGEVSPVQAIAKPPMIWNIVYQNTYEPPLLPVTKDSQQLEQRPDVLAASVAGGYQYADVPYVGPSVVVVTDGSAELAQQEAERLCTNMWSLRDELRLELPTPAEAVAGAKSASEFPVALFDTGDNVLGGSPGDTTAILQELLRQDASGWIVTICAPAAVKAATNAGLDGEFDQSIGDPPVRIRGRVRSLHAGRYMEPEVRHGGARFHDLGHSALIEADGSTPELQNLVLLTSLRSHPNSIHQLVSCGIYPERQRILVAKGTIAPRAAYQPVAKKIVLVDSPGATAINPAHFHYHRARQGLFGLS
jgi:microcystin degradation protein MlrC